MTAPRFDMYTLVHEGQRKKLFELTVAAGQLAADDGAGREVLAGEIDATLASLRDHADAEERFFGSLYREASPELAASLAAEHAAVDAEIAHVRRAKEEALANAAPRTDLALYRALARFSAAYLTHLAAEEGSLPELWARFEDAVLMRAQGELVAAHPPASVQFNLRNMLPAASPAERVGFLSNLRRNMPARAFAGVRQLVGTLVPASEWERIDAA
jgi:hypothetical protein